MTEFAYQARGLYFEDFEIGQIMETAARTITETDVVNFAGLSGDFNRIHTDAVYAAQNTFGQRVAHGLLVQSIATGLAVQSGIIEGTVIAFRELACKFSLPVCFGDTIHVKIEITDTKAFRRLGGGNITMKYSVINQDDKIVQRGDWVMLIKSKGN
ncbi:MAG: dehydratase [Chloroflexi bacterium]|nr:dehydratase [Chloroflexota bacterium]MBP7041532.1 dehydratase [Chloroflexota bacterium]